MKEVKVAQSSPTLCDPMDCSPWNSLGQNTAVGSLSLLQGIFPTQGATRANLHTIQRSNVKISAIKIPSLHLKKLSTSQQKFLGFPSRCLKAGESRYVYMPAPSPTFDGVHVEPCLCTGPLGPTCLFRSPHHHQLLMASNHHLTNAAWFPLKLCSSLICVQSKGFCEILLIAHK